MRRIIIGIVLLIIVSVAIGLAGTLLTRGEDGGISLNIRSQRAGDPLFTGGEETGPGAKPTAEPEPLTTEGIVVAAKEAKLSFGVGGTVTKVPVELGSLVQPGTSLATLDAADAELQLRSAENDVQARHAALEQLRTGPRPEDIASLKAAVAAARARLAQIEAATAADEQTALAQLQSAQARLTALTQGPAESDVIIADAALATAKARLAALEDGPTATDLAAADAALATAQARLAVLEDGPRAEDLAITDATLATAQARLAALEDGPRAEDLRVAESQVRQAEIRLAAARQAAQGGDLVSAQAGLESALTRLEQLQAGPTATDIAAAQAGIDTAENALAQLRDGSTSAEDVRAAELAVQQALVGLDRARAARDVTAGMRGVRSSQIAAADADIQTTKLAVQIAQNNLAKARSGATPWAVRQAQIAVEQAKTQLVKLTDPKIYDIRTAEASVEQARATLAKVGAALETEIAQAEAGLVQAQANLDRLLQPSVADLEAARQAVRPSRGPTPEAPPAQRRRPGSRSPGRVPS